MDFKQATVSKPCQLRSAARRDSSALEWVIAIFLLVVVAQPGDSMALALGAGAAGLAVAKSAWQRTPTLVGSGLVWGLFVAHLLVHSAANPVLGVVGLILVVLAALPVAASTGQQRLFTVCALLPAALTQFAQPEPAAMALGGLLVVLGLVADHVWRGLRPAPQPQARTTDTEDILSRELRAHFLRQSWQVIDGSRGPRNSASEKQQLHHQNSQGRV